MDSFAAQNKLAITKISRPKQAAATHLELGVATSANKIANALALYFCAASLYSKSLLVCEGELIVACAF
jgi:hypothetical protein